MRRCPLLALNGQSDRTCVCPLLDKADKGGFLARCGLSADDPKRTSALPFLTHRPIAKC